MTGAARRSAVARARTWSNMLKLEDVVSCFIRSVAVFSAHRPSFISVKMRSDSSTGRSRNGESTSPTASGCLRRSLATRRHSSISALVWWHTYAFPFKMSSRARR